MVLRQTWSLKIGSVVEQTQFNNQKSLNLALSFQINISAITSKERAIQINQTDENVDIAITIKQKKGDK